VEAADLLDEPRVQGQQGQAATTPHGRGHAQGQLACTTMIDQGGAGHYGEAPPVVLVEPAVVAAAAAQAQAQARRGAGCGAGRPEDGHYPWSRGGDSSGGGHHVAKGAQGQN
jgi:hypothetical protein